MCTSRSVSSFLPCSHPDKGKTNIIETPAHCCLQESDNFTFLPTNVVIPSLSASPKPIRATKQQSDHAQNDLTTSNGFSHVLLVDFLRFGCHCPMWFRSAICLGLFLYSKKYPSSLGGEYRRFSRHSTSPARHHLLVAPASLVLLELGVVIESL